MIDLFLQSKLVEEVREELKNYKSVNKNNELTSINVFSQCLPIRKTKEEYEYYPYVLVCIDEENIVDLEEQIEIDIYFLVGICDKDVDAQGHKDILNIINRLLKRFYEKQIIADKYRFKLPAKIKLQQEEYYPQYLGGMLTKWELTKLNIKEDEYV